MRTSAIFAIFAGLLLSAQAAAEVTPAKRLTSRSPSYPASCRSDAASNDKTEIVTVTYTVTEKGLPVSVRVVETTNACFNEAAIAAVRSWKFEPQKVDGKPTAQEDVETTFLFKLEEETQTEDFDARPIFRKPPTYPEKCMFRAANREQVLLEFDVDEQGNISDVRVVDSSNDCLSEAAARSVKDWKYSPKTVAGEPVVRKGVQVTITFVLEGGGGGASPDQLVRPLVYRNFIRAQTSIRDGDHEGALAKLAEIEERFGDTFSRAESATFYQLRGAARLSKKDYAGALDDLRRARTGIMDADAAQSIDATIAQLEKIVAVQAAQEAAEKSGEGSGEQ